MLDFGDEFTIETFKIPWLIWIQILILLLLIVLLYCFSLFSSDLDTSNSHVKNSSLASPSSPSSSVSTDSALHEKQPALKFNSTVTHRFQPSQVGGSQSIKGEIATSTGRRIVGGEENTEKDSSSSSICYHPCHYFKLAREAFLKCLGLDSEQSSNSEQRKDR
ncbi:hypothetical protein Patl1_27530 [Pistacia atlantica]|uniref:Uncharacterized protein n=1 Tax=Pistacia atlantica TaxID=434234 RepID=A0ACC1BBL5_9ROSI|nr:hypothetical protein Patl1_27530 [Pistacia atlantica]